MSFNYQNGLIYKIVCNNTDIKDCYVGSSTNFKQRKADHKKRCTNNTNKNHNLNVYKFIRDNGGWDNWSMIQIESYPCNTKRELESRERYWLEQLKANLNSRIPTRTNEEWRSDNRDYILEYDRERNKTDERKKQMKQKNIRNKDKTNARNRERYLTDEVYKKKIIERILIQKADIEKQQIYNANRKVNIYCECGSIIQKATIYRHSKTKKHKYYEEIYEFIYS